jgi:hypothetical protein
MGRAAQQREAWTAFAESRDLKPQTAKERHFAKGRLPSGVMNGTEAAYARELENQKNAGLILGYWFEAFQLKLAKLCTYTPDFLVLRADGSLDCVDVKGTTTVKLKDGTRRNKSFSQDDSRVKLRMCAGIFPFRFLIVFKVGGVWQEEVF